MVYDTIIDEFNRIINSDFNMQSLREIKKIYIYLNRAYRYELLKKNSNRKLCATAYEQYIKYVNDLVWNKLKTELKFEDEIINRIFAFVRVVDQIEDIYVIENNVIVKSNSEKEKKIAIAPELNLLDITSDSFIRGNENSNAASFIVMSINNTIRSLIQNRPTPDDILSINNNNINYTVTDLNIYASRTMSDILTDNTGNKITKLIVTYKNQLFYFDMKMRGKFLIINQGVEDIKIISEMLRKEEDLKTKK